MAAATVFTAARRRRAACCGRIGHGCRISARRDRSLNCRDVRGLFLSLRETEDSRCEHEVRARTAFDGPAALERDVHLTLRRGIHDFTRVHLVANLRRAHGPVRRNDLRIADDVLDRTDHFSAEGFAGARCTTRNRAALRSLFRNARRSTRAVGTHEVFGIRLDVDQLAVIELNLHRSIRGREHHLASEEFVAHGGRTDRSVRGENARIARNGLDDADWFAAGVVGGHDVLPKTELRVSVKVCLSRINVQEFSWYS